MERFFRSLKTEWVPTLGYRSFIEAKHSITDYVVGYYSQATSAQQRIKSKRGRETTQS